ncbi:hypothetical protein ACQEVZ_37235 [Dactylosporangium sp. CA-152071]|uniref:hypothetical protein n=1 Tax=Dactylosporangium sp. CA-152071 TaxID=3239933 RepID=UPI003D8C65E7
MLLPAGLLDSLAQVALSGKANTAAPTWVLPLAVLTYLGLVLLSGASAGFSSDADRREANFRVLRTLVPWTVFNITGQLLAPLLVHSLL